MSKLEIRNLKLGNASTSLCFSQFQISNFTARIQDIVLCGICGKRMTVRYHRRGERMYPDYVCQSEAIEHVSGICSRIPGTGVDKAIGDLLLEMLTPMTLEVALAVQQELLERIEDADQIRAKQVERSRYEADLARRRYMKVDPDNRLVADMLEAEWNGKLRALQQAQEEYERQRQADLMMVDEEARECHHRSKNQPKPPIKNQPQ